MLSKFDCSRNSFFQLLQNWTAWSPMTYNHELSFIEEIS